VGTATSVPAPVQGLPPARALSLGAAFSCALTDAGAVYCWGKSDSGQLGDGVAQALRPTPAPVQLPAEPFVAVAAGARHACALGASGAVYCWGDNSEGAIGDGTTTARPLPVAPSGLPLDVTGLSAGAGFTCVARAGVAHCWGSNVSGQSDATTRAPVLRPAVLPPFAGAVRSVSCAAGFACAVLQGGGVQCGGRNDQGQLGDGSQKDRAFPAPVLGLFHP
jgi:alpha-tubulin suppressor-like RCC1 family protein